MLEPLRDLDWDTLKDRVATRIRRQILAGAIPPGFPLPEARLAESLRVSRSTIRDGLHLLEREGLVVLRPRQAPIVRQLTASEIGQTYEVREILESKAADQLARLDPVAREAATATLFEAIEALAEVHGGEQRARIDADLHFHESLVALSHNSILLETWQHLRFRLRLAMLAAPSSVLKQAATGAHTDIVEAINEADGSAATALIADHFRYASSLMAGPWAKATTQDVPPSVKLRQLDDHVGHD